MIAESLGRILIAFVICYFPCSILLNNCVFQRKYNNMESLVVFLCAYAASAIVGALVGLRLLEKYDFLISIIASCIVVTLAHLMKSTDTQQDNKVHNSVTNTAADDTKKCPFCAELIKLEALKCKHCGERFDTADVEEQIKQHKAEKERHIFNNEYKLLHGDPEEAFCIGCRTVSAKNGMYYHRRTDTYYHEKCLQKEMGGIA